MELLPGSRLHLGRGAQAAERRTEAQEREVSYERRVLHGQIDILRAEIVARLPEGRAATSVLDDLDVDRLTEILDGQGDAA